jgi:LPPG:FO 2-phospho-L-lactate transferase
MSGGSVVVLAGGVGGAKLAHGLLLAGGPALTIVVNTGDDLERHGLAIWPDHDTVCYTLAGLDDRDRGWGLRDETWATIDQLERLGAPAWFRLGDRDLATHLVRTEALRAGIRPTVVAADLQRRLGVPVPVLPMADEPVRTEVRSDEGWLDFQTYFVARRQEPAVLDVRFRGIEAARPTVEVATAIAGASAIVLAPSNPFVSIGPILAVPGMGEAIAAARAAGTPIVGVSPIVGGRALKGPADRMLVSLGHASSALGVAEGYAGIIDGFVVDAVDAELAPAIEALGITVDMVDTVMVDDAARARLGVAVLAFAERLGARPAASAADR